jgi:phosphotriesterase-related protein
MATVETVLGPVDASRLGNVLSHEHIIVSNGEDWQHYPWLYDRQKTLDDAVRVLKDLKAGGVDSMIDLTTPDLGRDIDFMIDVAKQSDVHIIAGTGIWRDPPRSIMERDIDRTADIFVREIEQGIGSTSVKAAAIKVANDIEGFTEAHVRILRAAARACKRTGCPISTHHNATMQMGTTQVRIFKEEGAPMDRIAIGHSADSTDIDYLESLLKEGVYLSLDRYPGRAPRPTWEQRNATVKTLIEHGWGDKLMLGHDGWVTSWMRAGDPAATNAYLARQPEGMSFVTRIAVPALLKDGVSQAQVDALLRDTPRRFLTGEK